MDTFSFQPHTVRQKAEEVSGYLKLLSNPTRLAVLCGLVNGPRCVSDLESMVGISQSALSQHLAKLRKQGLVQAERDGKQIYYAIEDPKAARILEVLYELFCADLPSASNKP